jgi:hypothetical protein
VYNKSKSLLTFKEFEKKINEHNTFENDWGFYIDIDNNNNKILKNISNSYNNININNNNFFSKYSTVISIALFTIIIIIIV